MLIASSRDKKMAEDREPPPFGGEEEDNNQKDEDDLFADASEKSPEENGEVSPAEPVKEEKTRIPVDVNIIQDEDEEEKPPVTEPAKLPPADDDEDIFGSGGTEVKLDSDEDEPEPQMTNNAVASEPEPIKTLSAEEERPKLDVSHSSTTASKVSSTSRTSREEEIEEEPYTIEIKVTDPHKVGDGMGAYVVYRVITKTTIPAFRRPEMSVVRRFSDFLGLHDKLSEKHLKYGRILPPAPEKSVIGMAKTKMSKEESGSNEFIERRRAALERYLNRTASHPQLRMDPDFRDFLEREGDLPKATSTSALSGAGVKRLLSRVGDAMEKITFKMDESDEISEWLLGYYVHTYFCTVFPRSPSDDQWDYDMEWFEEKQQQIENLDQQLRKLHSGFESLVHHRRELSTTTAVFAKSAAMLGNAEEHTALSRALSQLAETEEKIEQLHKEQSEQDFFTMAELLKDYIALMGAVKEVLHERVKTYKHWKDCEATLTKKRETKAKLELAHKNDKLPQATQEITEWEHKVEKGKKDFQSISETIRKEVARFDRQRVEDFKSSVVKYLQHLMDNQQQLIKYWEAFLPEAKAIA